MSIKTASVTPKAIKLKAPSGVVFETTSVLFTSGTGEAVFSFVKPYSAPSDDGLWEIYSADKNQISDVAGNLLVSNEKLGEFVVGETEDAIAKADAEIAALKARQDAQFEALQKTTQSVADLAILVASGAGGPSNDDLKTLQDKLTALDTGKADKTALDTLNTTVTALNAVVAVGASDQELADAIAKVDAAIALIESALKPLVGRTLYTTIGVTHAIAGDSIFIDSDGDIQMPATPVDGAEVKIFDPYKRIKGGKNNISLGVGDLWLMPDGTFESKPLAFLDNHLLGGWVRFKYSLPTKSWSSYVVYGSVASPAVTGLSKVQHDAGEAVPLPISSTASVQFHLEGGAGAWIDTSLPDGWWGTVLNTTNTPQPILFDDDDLMVFSRDGEPTDLVASPYELGPNSAVTLQMVENGFKFLQIIPQGGGSKAAEGDRVESLPLGTLDAGAWTPFPDASGTIKDFKIFDASGNDVSAFLETRRAATGWEVFSLVPQNDLVFEYEIAPAGNARTETVVMPLLPARIWTRLPAASGTVSDYKIFDSDVDISDYLEIRRINGIYEVFSLVDKVNLQVEYEIGA